MNIVMKRSGSGGLELMTVGTLAVEAQQTSAPPAAAAALTNALGAEESSLRRRCMTLAGSRSGEPVKYTYVFTNTGDRLLILNSVQPQCGCTAAGEWTKQVEPGKTGSIPIQFNTDGLQRPGLQTDDGHLQCHEPAHAVPATQRHGLQAV